MISPKNILLVVIDTLRADHLGCYGYARNTSQVIDSIAAEGIRFKHAFSPCSFTLPSHASLFTSKRPSAHSIGFNQMSGKLDTDSDITLAEVLKSKGYATSAFVSTMVLRKGTGLNAGFDIYDDLIGDSNTHKKYMACRHGHETTQKALKWLDRYKDHNFFIFLHYFDVHGPYYSGEPFDNFFIGDQYYGKEQLLESIVPENCPIGGIPYYMIQDSATDNLGNLQPIERDVRRFIAQYDGCIRFVDGEIDRVINRLKDLELYDDTLIVITSDHGEAFGENDIYFIHSATVTPDQIHVPLIIKPHSGWGIRPQEPEAAVSLIDIMPTILSMLNGEDNSLGLEGISLRRLIEQGIDPAVEGRIIVSENELQEAYIYNGGTIRMAKKEHPESSYHVQVPELIDLLHGRQYSWCVKQNCKDETAFATLKPDYRYTDSIKRRQILALGEQVLRGDGHIKYLEHLLEDHRRRIAELEPARRQDHNNRANDTEVHDNGRTSMTEDKENVVIDDSLGKTNLIGRELDWTGERFLPYLDYRQLGSEIHYEHLHRYAYASSFVKGKDVLDLASGEGYGSYLIAKTAKYVIGVDIDHRAVEHARMKYDRVNLDFVEGSILNIPIAGAKLFDVIVCFEAIEHVSEHDVLMQEITRLLKDDGLLIISTPNKKSYSDDVHYNNPFHLKEIYLHEFRNLLSSRFLHVTLLGQSVQMGSGLWHLDRTEEPRANQEHLIRASGREFSFADPDDRIPKYYVALASNAPGYQALEFDSTLVDLSDTLITTARNWIAHIEKLVPERDARIKYLEGEFIKSRDEVKNSDQTLDKLDLAVIERDVRISTLSDQLMKFQQEIYLLEHSVTDRDITIVQMKDLLSQQSAQIEKLERQAEQNVERSASLEREITDLKRGIVWRLTNGFQTGIVDRFIGRGTRRRQAYDSVFSDIRRLTGDRADRR